MLEFIYQTLLESGALESTLNAILTAALAAVAAVFSYVGLTIKSKFERDAEVRKIENAQNYLKIMDDVIETTVNALNGTIKAELLEKAADGRITKEEGAELLEYAVVTVKAATTPVAQEAISLIVSDLDQYIRLKIEALLVAQKMDAIKKAEKQKLDTMNAEPQVTTESSIEYTPVEETVSGVEVTE